MIPFDIEDDLFDLFDEIKKNNAVDIVTADGTPVGIVTSYDAAEFLRIRSEGLIELRIYSEQLKPLFFHIILAAITKLTLTKLTKIFSQ